jgi:hypothetical protein
VRARKWWFAVLPGLLTASLCALGEGTRAESTWSRVYGGPSMDRFFRILPTYDGSFVIPGSFVNGEGDWDGRVVKVSPTGEVVDAWAIGGKGNDFIYRATPLADGGYLLGGMTASYGAGRYDVWLMKLDAYGDLAWQKAYGQRGDEHLDAIIGTPDGGAVVAADIDGGYFSGADAWVFKVDASGDVAWSELFPGIYDDEPRTLCAGPGGFIWMLGSTGSIDPGGPSWLVEFDPNGAVQSQFVFRGSDTTFSCEDMTRDGDGNFLILGQAHDAQGNPTQVVLVKMDVQGSVLWQESIGDVSSSIEGCRVLPDALGGFFVAGGTASLPGSDSSLDGWAARFGSGGQVLWQNRYGESHSDLLVDALQAPDIGLLLVGTEAYEGPNQGDGWLLKAGYFDGAMDGGCTFVTPTSFQVTELSAWPSHAPSRFLPYAVQTTDTTAEVGEVSLTATLVCSSPHVCTVDGTATALSRTGVGYPTHYQATPVALDCPGPPAYAWSFGDGDTSTQRNPAHAYASVGTFDWSVVMSTGGQSVTKTGSITVVNPPVVSSLRKVSPPFSIVVSGSNFRRGTQVFIDGAPWLALTHKTRSEIKLEGGRALKAVVPKGVAHTFLFANPDGGLAVKTWQW